jgi:hypothetical protein
MDLIESIDNACRHINRQIPRINSGGCAVFASLLAQCLTRYGDVKIAIGDDDSFESVDTVRKNVFGDTADDWNQQGVSFNHVVTEFTYKGESYHIDSSGVHPANNLTHVGDFSILPGRMTVPEVMGIAASHLGWNRMFNRDTIPAMKDLFDTEFAKISQGD